MKKYTPSEEVRMFEKMLGIKKKPVVDSQQNLEQNQTKAPEKNDSSLINNKKER